VAGGADPGAYAGADAYDGRGDDDEHDDHDDHDSDA
jgi:hypothetical protein